MLLGIDRPGPLRRWPLAVFAVLLPVLLASQGAAVGAEPRSRESIVEGFQSQLEPLLYVPTGSTADVDRCIAGSSSEDNKQASLAAVNYLRSLAGLNPVRLNSQMSQKAQAAALVMAANGLMTHFPSPDLRCYSKNAYAGASHSNLYLGGRSSMQEALTDSTGARAMIGYLEDEGGNNESVGHRRWLLWRGLKEIGVGDTLFSNATYVVPTPFTRVTSGDWVMWPAAGYFPRELEPKGRWSLSKPGAIFSSAKISMIGPDGQRIPVRRLPVANGYGDNTVVWEFEVPTSFTDQPLLDHTFTVLVTNIRLAGRVMSKSWTTTLVPASVMPLPPGSSLVERIPSADQIKALTVRVHYWNTYVYGQACMDAQRKFYEEAGWNMGLVSRAGDLFMVTGTQRNKTISIKTIDSFSSCALEIRVA